ncbi:hypothetical protein PR202_gb27060 [Eleusine coracana subsp. coracana]|uniref:Secreted protein n=1 Tax=Eleusine coracana subsp. coracana TaxID=191504 RepID=A0AAV5FTR4_ELECO|nr:hypothetical protein PR202_gb27060 [Eleusine coracana subsp. coracana]
MMRRWLTNLIHVELDVDKRHSLVGVAVVLKHAVQRLRDILHHEVQEQLVPWCCRKEAVFQADDVGVIHRPHNLQLAVLVTLVLKHLLDGHSLSRLQTLSLKDKKTNSVSIESTSAAP